VVERLGLLQRTPQTRPVFDVTAEAADPRVEDVLQRVLPEEQVAQHSDAPSHRPRPQSTQFGDGVYFALLGFEVRNEFFRVEAITLDNWL